MNNSPQTLEYIDTALLIPYVRNSRTHSHAQIIEIADSIEAFGMVGAIIVRDRVIAKGHGTLAAAISLYSKGKLIYPAPGKQAGIDPLPLGTVPVIDVSGWSEAQFKAFVIADNKIGDNSGWDEDMLLAEMQDLKDMDFDLDVVGFSIKELENLFDVSDDLGLNDPKPPKNNSHADDLVQCPKCSTRFKP